MSRRSPVRNPARDWRIVRRNPQGVQSNAGKLAGKRFLIVEDEPLVALDVEDGLTAAGGVVVASVASSKEALELIANTELDAALLDGNLSGQPVDEIAAAREATLLNKPFSQPQLLDVAATLAVAGGDFIPLRKR